MSLVPLILDLYDGALNPVAAGTASLTPSVQLTDPGTGIAVESGPAVVFRPSSPTPLTWILPTDVSGWAPSGWGWIISFSGVPGSPAAFTFKISSTGYLRSFTATSASPAVFTASGSALTDGTAVALSGSSLPGGFSGNLAYYVVSASGDTFSLALTPGGGALASTSAGSGTAGVVQYLSSMSPQSDVTAMAAYAQVLAGDLDGGSSADPVVTGIQGIPVSSTPPSSGNVLTYNGTEYVPGAGYSTVPVSGQYLCAPSVYAPASLTSLPTTSATLAAVSSANVNTGAFTAPPSGSVTVTVSLVTTISAACSVSFGLAQHGSVTPCANVITSSDSGATVHLPRTLVFAVTGLTPGSSYTLDLLFAVTGGTTLNVAALGSQSTTPTGTIGGPVTMTVQAV